MYEHRGVIVVNTAVSVAEYRNQLALLRLASDLVAACEAQGFFIEITEAYREAEKE